MVRKAGVIVAITAVLAVALVLAGDEESEAPTAGSFSVGMLGDRYHRLLDCLSKAGYHKMTHAYGPSELNQVAIPSRNQNGSIVFQVDSTGEMRPADAWDAQALRATGCHRV